MSRIGCTKRSVLTLGSYALLALVGTHPLWMRAAGSVPMDIGDPLLNAWIIAWETHALLAGPFRLFDANIFHPLQNTLAFSEHVFSTAMLLFPVSTASGEPVFAYNVGLVGAFVLSAYGMYLLALRWTSDRGAAYAAGLAFGFAPYRFAAVSHLQLLTVQWLPLGLLALDCLLRCGDSRRRRLWGVLLVLFASMQVLASWYLALFAAMVMGIYALAWMAAHPGEVRAALPRLAVAIAAVALFAAPFAWPYLGTMHLLEEARPPEVAASLAARAPDYLAAAPHNLLFGAITAPFAAREGFTAENYLFLGVAAPLLALLGIAAARTKGTRWRTAALAVTLALAVTMTLGGPYGIVTALVPPLGIVRAPPRWIAAGIFALAGLAGFGAARLLRGRAWAAVPLAALVFLEGLSVPLPLAEVGAKGDLPAIYARLARISRGADSALVELPMYTAPGPEYPEVKRMYASTVGWWRLVNGYSGLTPPGQAELGEAMRGFPSDSAYDALRGLASGSGVPLYLVVHPGEKPFDRAEWEDAARYGVERSPALLPIDEAGGDYLYYVRPGGAALDAPGAECAGGEANFTADGGGAVSLRGYCLLRREEGLRLVLYWEADGRLQADYTVFVHLAGGDGGIVAQGDSPPVSGRYPTGAWQPGETVQDVHDVDTAGIEAVSALVGLYEAESGRRLPLQVRGGEWQAAPDDALLIELK